MNCLVQCVLMRRLQISHPMASLVVASASPVAALPQAAVEPQVVASPVAALPQAAVEPQVVASASPVAALHLRQVLASASPVAALHLRQVLAL